MTSKRSIFLASLCGLALVGAGCGDDDENKALSYDDTGSEISEICDRVQGATDDLNGDPKNDAPVLATFADEFETAVEDLRDLDVAEELAETRDDFADNADAQITIIREAQAIAESGDKKKYVAKVKEAEPLDKESDELASQLGASGCLGDDG
jgi:hypothetical protein